MRVRQYSSFENLPGATRDCLTSAGRRNFFFSISWFQALLEKASPSGDQLCIFVAETSEHPTAILVAKQRNEAGALRSHMLLGLSQGTYTSLYGPILHDDGGAEGLREILLTIARTRPSFDVLRFDSLERRAPAFDLMVTVFRSAGMIVQPFFNFRNWFENVSGLSVEEYRSSRSPETRDLISRHVGCIEESGRGRFQLITGGAGLPAALTNYELVDLQSWKPPEPYPFFIPQIVHSAARAGVLRLGLFYIDNEPAAAQIWIVNGGKATILRVHYAEKFAELEVETVLTYEMFRHVIENDQIEEIDFDRRSDPYTRQWLKCCRERAGLLIFNPRTVKGSIIASRHVGGHLLMDCARKLGIAGRNASDLSVAPKYRL